MAQIKKINLREVATTSFSTICGYCSKHVELKPHVASRSQHKPEFIYVLCECAVCNGFSMVTTMEHDRQDTYISKVAVVKIHPETHKPTTPAQLPESLKPDWTALVELVGNPTQKATVVMLCRKIIDLVTKEFELSEPTLYLRIEKLDEQRLIAPQLKDWAHTIRTLGNVGAHDPAEDTTNEEANELWDFTQLFVEYLYILPARIKAVGKPEIEEEV